MNGDLNDVRLLQGGDGETLPFRCSHRQIGGLRIGTAALPAGLGRLSDHGPVLLLPLAGACQVSALDSNLSWLLAADQALFLPRGAWELRWDRLSLALVRLVGRRPEDLSGGDAPPRHWCCSDPLVRDLLDLLRRSLALLDHDLLRSPEQGGSDSFSAVLLQQLRMLVQVADSDQPPPQGAAGADVVVDELLIHIQTHLHQPLRLQELEELSGYSRRSLQYAFQRRFGCGPMQWVKRERLQAARRELEHPQPDDTVSLISQRYGYTSLSSFSRDIHQAFGVCPSTLLRRGQLPQVPLPPNSSSNPS